MRLRTDYAIIRLSKCDDEMAPGALNLAVRQAFARHALHVNAKDGRQNTVVE